MAAKSIKIDSFLKQITLFAALVLCVVAVVFAVRWCAANAIASHTIYRDVADLAQSWAPDDPQTHYTSAVLWERSFAAEDVPKAIGEYERATALSPHDYRTWHALGRARERSGDASGALAALERAQALAPNYAQVSWTLGNVLLRQNRRGEAFAQMRRAAEADRIFVNPTAATAWQIFAGDLRQIKEVLGDSAPINAVFVAFLSREKRFGEAAEIWNSLPADERASTFKENGAVLFDQLLAAGKYRDAAQMRALSSDAGKVAVGKIFNGDFEAELELSGAIVFDWQLAAGAQPQIAIDEREKRGGNRSLTIVFNSSTGREFRAVSQIVAVDSGGKYSFEMFYKSELKAAATVYWEITDAAGGKILAQTPPIVAAAEWTSARAEFAAPPNSEAVVIRLVREPCKSIVCPISGRIWFDDFSLAKI